ncbi:MAG: RecX family transcriptional regulator [Flavobacteriales bacterium]|nr:RecX family transcriptional regulator [Flavobacteriales bacterium]
MPFCLGLATSLLEKGYFLPQSFERVKVMELNPLERKVADLLSRWCAQQDRCISKAREKCKQRGLNNSQIDNVVDWLLELDFLDDERFAQSYARGKFRQKRWGEIKIRHHLRVLKIEGYLIDRAIQKELKRPDVLQSLEDLIEYKKRLDQPDKPRMIRYLQGRGYRLDDILNVLD